MSGWKILLLASSLTAMAAGCPEETDPRFLPTPAEKRTIGRLVEAFRQKYDVPGLSLAISRGGRLVFQAAYGFADRNRGEMLTPRHLFRIASVSKPVTAAGILRLVEMGRLRLDDRVFGPGGILEDEYEVPPAGPLCRITVDHLLTHTAGGWSNDGRDPMFRHPRLNARELIARTLAEVPPEHAPGSRHAYSNFGYCVLGRVIEKVTGRPYETWIRQNILMPAGAAGMRVARNGWAGRAPDEVTYECRDGDPYRLNIRRMDAHGGWLATPTDLVAFANSVDGFRPAGDLLRPETIRLMTTPGARSPCYARGWAVNAAGNWWHSGSLPGTTAILVRTSDDFCWAAVANTRTKGMVRDLDRLMWTIRNAVPAWRVARPDAGSSRRAGGPE
jgi:Beta-lactamase class C and other penicillin binding proteins